LYSTTVATALSLQWAEFVNSNGIFARRKVELENIKKHLDGGGVHKGDELAAFWRHYQSTRAPHLANVALSLLSICATEAAVERSFSAQSLVHSKTRSRLYGDAVESLMMLRFNRDVVDAAPTRTTVAGGPGLSFTASELELLPDGDIVCFDDDNDVNDDDDDEQDANRASDAVEEDAENDTVIESAVPAAAAAAAATAAMSQCTAAQQAVQVAYDWVQSKLAHWIAVPHRRFNYDMENAVLNYLICRRLRLNSVNVMNEVRIEIRRVRTAARAAAAAAAAADADAAAEHEMDD
jgi:hypothetical protein